MYRINFQRLSIPSVLGSMPSIGLEPESGQRKVVLRTPLLDPGTAATENAEVPGEDKSVYISWTLAHSELSLEKPLNETRQD